MARNYAQITTAIWVDPDFRALDSEAQRLYLFLVSQPDVSLVGVVHARTGPWARCAADQTRGSVEWTLTTLTRSGLIEWDRDEEEVWIRGFIRHNVTGSPKAVLGASRALGAVASSRLSDRILEEVHPDLRGPFSTEFDGLDFAAVKKLIGGLGPWSPPPKTPSDTPYPPRPDTPPHGVSDSPSDGVSAENGSDSATKPAVTCDNAEIVEPKNRVSDTPFNTETGDLRPETRDTDLHLPRKPRGCGQAVPDDDEVDQQTRRAARVLAKGELADLTYRPDNVDAWVASTAKAKLDEHGDQIRILIRSGLSAEDAAGTLVDDVQSEYDRLLARIGGNGQHSADPVGDRTAAAQRRNMEDHTRELRERNAEWVEPSDAERAETRRMIAEAKAKVRADGGVDDLDVKPEPEAEAS